MDDLINLMAGSARYRLNQPLPANIAVAVRRPAGARATSFPAGGPDFGTCPAFYPAVAAIVWTAVAGGGTVADAAVLQGRHG